MIILNCDQHRNLSFVDKKYRILQGEHKFDEIKINMPETIDGVDDMQGVSIKMHFVSGNEHVDRQVVLENDYISTDIDYTLTEKSKRWLLYLAFYVNVDGEVEIGKTNAIAIQVNKLPYSDTLAKEYKEPEIVLIKGDKGDKGDPGEDGKSAYEIAVEHGYEGTEEEWLSEMKDYNELDNKPRINGHTLSGNKSADNLGLQDKLTAGENITISSGNVISAESGGVTSYNDLTDKPKYNINYDGTFTNKDIIGIIKLLQPFFQDENGITLKNITNQSLQDYTQYFYGFYSRAITYNFGTTLNHIFIRCGCFSTTVNSCSNIPSAFSPYLPSNDLFYIIHLFTTHGAYNSQLARMVIFEDNTNHKIRVFAQLIGCEHSNPEATITAITDWEELGGSIQIVSAVVNANGTITFTDSEGNTFTTTGSSVIGPQGDDYVLTAQDKSDIADIVLSELPTTQGVLYGNTSN